MKRFLANPELTWLATEREKVAHFTLKTRLQAPDLPNVVFGKPPNTTIRYFPDKLPIGFDSGGWTHIFLYLVTMQAGAALGLVSVGDA